MTARDREVDVVVVGAGTAGANAAHQLARRGRRVLLVERRPADAGGAQWHNGVLDRQFAEAGLAPPTGDERAAAGVTVHIRARDPRTGPTIVDAPPVRAHMGLLGRRLRELATGSGVEVVDRVQHIDAQVDGAGRLRSVVLRREDGADVTVAASLFVDAAGRTGVLRRHAPALAPWCPTVPGGELCSAADVEHHVDDAAGAERFLARHGAEPGDTVTVVGVSGGFSTASVAVAADLGHVGILVGCLASGAYGTAPQLLADLLRREPWIGGSIASGAGVIPLRRPYARLTAPGLALVGDAACQVFPAHGSGIGIGLMAGTMLAEAVEGLDDPGDERQLWARYQAPFVARHGADLLAYDAMRRGSTRLGSDGVDALITSGVGDEATLRAGLDQRWAVPEAAAAMRSGGRLARHPRLAAVMVPTLARAQALRLHAARYPATLDLAALERWERRTTRLLGALPT
jgi:flavin-dependent dehydrogenase